MCVLTFLETDKKKKMGVGTGWQAGDVTPAENLLSGGKTSS